jgi:cell division protein FtsN
MTYDFSLDRKSTFVLGAGSLVLVLLVFLAGFLAGMSWRREPQMAATHRSPATVAAALLPPLAGPKASTAAPNPAAPASSDPVSPIPSKQATEPQQQAPAVVAPAQAPAPATQAAANLATAALPSAPEQSGVRLAIQVGAFLQKSNAEKLADQLKHSGYNSQIVLAGVGSKQWNIVRVGPYQDWDEATQIAAQLSREQAGPAVIRPIR